MIPHKIGLNCHSLKHKFLDISGDKVIVINDVICLTETWLKKDVYQESFKIEGYSQHFNSFGDERGKGIAVYYRSEKFTPSAKVKLPNLQISRISSADLDVITVYRSSNCSDALRHILSLINMERSTVICGDFNLCFVVRNDHPVIQSLLNLGFEQKVTRATHIQGGTIDHVYFRKGGGRL